MKISCTGIDTTGCFNTLATPLHTPQPKLKVAQYNQTYCQKSKVKSISAMDFQYFFNPIEVGLS